MVPFRPTPGVNVPHVFDATLLRENDLRGIVGQTLFPADAYALGRSFGSVAVRRGATSMMVGYDGRHSSPTLADALAAGLADCGLKVAAIGRGPTPMLYFACHELKADGGIMITGSHNPPDYNGFKMVLQGEPSFGDGIRDLGRIAAAADYETGTGVIESLSVFDSYVDRVLGDFSGSRPLKVA